MSDIGLFQNIGGSSSGTGGPVTLTFTEGIQKHLPGKRDTDTTIPAGALYLYAEPFFAGENITINGKDYELGQPYKAEVIIDWVNKIQDYVPEVIIESNGFEFSFIVAYPSSNPIDLNTI